MATVQIDQAIIDRDRLKWAKAMPESYRRTYVKAICRQSRPAAIKAKCLACCNWQRVEVQNCTCTTCPLYEYRPYQGRERAPTVSFAEFFLELLKTAPNKGVKPSKAKKGGFE